tara:strand:- start:138 stop:512 length:375 start_codon:yes stop_codon:yes gene_type:complete
MNNLYDIMNLSTGSGDIDVSRALELLSCNEVELTHVLGLPKLVGSKTLLVTQLKSLAVYQHLLKIISVINFVHDMGVTRRESFEWFIAEKIPALGHITAKDAIIDGHFDALIDYLQAFKLGGYA